MSSRKCRQGNPSRRDRHRPLAAWQPAALTAAPSFKPSRCDEQPPPRICLDPDNVQQGLAKLVLTIIELLRQLLEKQAIRRMEDDNLTDAQLERMGKTFINLEEKVTELKNQFGLSAEDLNIHLGPLGDLL